MSLKFIPPSYEGGRHLLRCGAVDAGAVFPPVGHGGQWVWRLWICGKLVAQEGRAKSEQAAKNAIMAAIKDFLRAAELKVSA